MYSFVVAFVLGVLSSVGEGQLENKCSVFPKDPYIEVGTDIEIVCQSSCVHGDVFWTVGNTPVDQRLSNSVSSSHTILSLRNFTHQNATVLCHSVQALQILGGTTIRTYSKPRAVSCVWHYDNQAVGSEPELFTCSWEHRMNYLLKTHYTVLRASLLQPSQTEICSSKSTTCTSKQILTSGKISLEGNVTIVVRARTAVWETYSDPYEFDSLHILKMSRPEVNITSFSDHLLVEWISSPTSKMCHCQVKYYQAVDGRAHVRMLSSTVKAEERGNVTIEQVEPCTKYKLSVRCALVGAPWSDWSPEETSVTQLNKNNVKMNLWRKVTKPGPTGVRKVHVMWREIPSACPGSFTYSVEQTPHRDHETGGNSSCSSCVPSTCEVTVNEDAHRLKLSVYHNGGFFTEDSVYVPAIGESLPRVTHVQTSSHQGVVVVSWKAPVQPPSGYVIDWTHNGNHFHWQKSNYSNITLFNLLVKKPYNITVTPLFDDKSGLGTQAAWVCSRLGDPANISIVDVQAHDKSAFVSWDIKSQEACRGAVVNFTVYYGAQDEAQLGVTVEGTEQNVLLKDLTPDTQYRVYIKATALTGVTISKERLFTTKTFDHRLVTALIVCGLVAIVLVIGPGLCCVIHRRKIWEKPVPNPGLSSVALWSSQSHPKPFSDPSESHYERVYTEKTLQPASESHLNPSSGLKEENSDPAISAVLDVRPERTADPGEALQQSSGESVALLSTDSSTLNPYRCQSSMEAPGLRTKKQCRQVYVTLEIYEESQGRQEK